MLGAGTILNPILKIVTTVAILAAVYFFLVKPTLNTTERLAAPALDAVQEAQQQFDQAFDDVPDAAALQNQINDAIGDGTIDTSKTDKLLKCVQRANQNVTKIQVCTNRFGA